MSSFATSDLYDRHGEVVQVSELSFQSYGGRTAFAGRIVTAKCHEDNSRLKELLAQPGSASVLVVDGGGSLRAALLGDLIGAAAVKNGWEGVLIHGAVRDADALSRLDLGVYALGTTPRKSVRRSEGQTGLSVSFGNVLYRQDAYVYVDRDGVIVANEALP
jgi:regulator of ribonuclease activity A